MTVNFGFSLHARQFSGVAVSESQETLQNPQELQTCMEEVRELVLTRINTAVAGKLIGSVNCLRESFVGL